MTDSNLGTYFFKFMWDPHGPQNNTTEEGKSWKSLGWVNAKLKANDDVTNSMAVRKTLSSASQPEQASAFWFLNVSVVLTYFLL